MTELKGGVVWPSQRQDASRTKKSTAFFFVAMKV
jgi:hypothetical protein